MFILGVCEERWDLSLKKFSFFLIRLFYGIIDIMYVWILYCRICDFLKVG